MQHFINGAYQTKPPALLHLDPAVAGLAVCDSELYGLRTVLTISSAIGQPQKHTIYLYNLLWAEVGETAITLQFAVPISRSSVKPASLTYPFEDSIRENVERWVSNLLAKAYEGLKYHPSRQLEVLANYSRLPSIKTLQSYYQPFRRFWTGSQYFQQACETSI